MNTSGDRLYKDNFQRKYILFALFLALCVSCPPPPTHTFFPFLFWVGRSISLKVFSRDNVFKKRTLKTLRGYNHRMTKTESAQRSWKWLFICREVGGDELQRDDSLPGHGKRDAGSRALDDLWHLREHAEKGIWKDTQSWWQNHEFPSMKSNRTSLRFSLLTWDIMPSLLGDIRI